jgi:hypothetical protein
MVHLEGTIRCQISARASEAAGTTGIPELATADFALAIFQLVTVDAAFEVRTLDLGSTGNAQQARDAPEHDDLLFPLPGTIALHP